MAYEVEDRAKQLAIKLAEERTRRRRAERAATVSQVGAAVAVVVLLFSFSHGVTSRARPERSPTTRDGGSDAGSPVAARPDIVDAAPPPEPRARLTDQPAGFTFLSSVDEARTRCLGHSQSDGVGDLLLWSSREDGHECKAIPNAALAKQFDKARLSFCDGQLTRVALLTRLGSFDSHPVISDLTEKYGPPTLSDRGGYRTEWTWPDGSSVLVRIFRAGDELTRIWQVDFAHRDADACDALRRAQLERERKGGL